MWHQEMRVVMLSMLTLMTRLMLTMMMEVVERDSCSRMMAVFEVV